MTIPESELIINEDGSVYHLKLKPGEVSEHIITVGDPDRVDQITQHFDKILMTRQNREFKTVTGELNGQLLSVIATGIGTDNIDIVINELDALFNVDFNTRALKANLTSLNFIRIGTSGTVQPDVPIDSFIRTKYAIGFDGLLTNYVADEVRIKELESLLDKYDINHVGYAVEGSKILLDQFNTIGQEGITVTAAGFYGPQSREIRLKPKYNLVELAKTLRYNNLNLTNIEMETAGIYGLSKLLGHQAISLNAILANRATGAFSKQAPRTISKLIEKTLSLI